MRKVSIASELLRKLASCSSPDAASQTTKPGMQAPSGGDEAASKRAELPPETAWRKPVSDHE